MSTVVASTYIPREHTLGFHARSEQFAVLVWHRRAGKQLCIETPIPMYLGGFKRNGDLVAGDIIFDEKGNPTTVLAVHEIRYGCPCFEVKFDDGSIVLADGDHLWYTTTKTDRTHRSGRSVGGRYSSGTQTERRGTVKTTSEIAGTLRARGESNHRVPVCEAVKRPTADLPIDPYILGLWLGDGTSRSTAITTMDPEIVAAWQQCANEFGQTLRQLPYGKTGKASTYAITGNGGGMQKALTRMKLWNNKHIPQMYMDSSAQQRWALLQGLMDSDGSVRAGRNTCEITQVKSGLSEQIAELLSSLGCKNTTSRKQVKGKYYYRVCFSTQRPPFRLPRKIASWTMPSGSNRAFSTSRSIVSVTPVATRPMRCITVDSPNSLYLCGKSYIPTHNTVACINDLIDKAIQNGLQMPRYGYVAPLYKQAKDVAWSYLKLYAAPLIEKVMESELSVLLKNGALIRLYGADNPDSLRGVYFDGLILDEYGDMEPRLFGEVLAPTLVDRNGWCVFIGTPKGPNHFEKIWKEALANTGWFTQMLRADESGIISPENLALMKTLPGSDEESYEQEFLCSFSAAVRGAYYGKQLNELNHEGSYPHDENKLVFTAWDIGYSDDTSVWFYQYNGKEIAVIDFFTVSGYSVDEVVDELRAKDYKYGTAFLPHDAKNKSFQTGKSTRELMIAHGMTTTIVPSLSIQDGIQAVRKTLPRVYFNTANPDVRVGLSALKIYQRKWDPKRSVFMEAPDHNWASNPADAFRMLALSTTHGTERHGSKSLNPRRPPTGNVVTLEGLYADRKARTNTGRI